MLMWQKFDQNLSSYLFTSNVLNELVKSETKSVAPTFFSTYPVWSKKTSSANLVLYKYTEHNSEAYKLFSWRFVTFS